MGTNNVLEKNLTKPGRLLAMDQNPIQGGSRNAPSHFILQATGDESQGLQHLAQPISIAWARLSLLLFWTHDGDENGCSLEHCL